MIRIHSCGGKVVSVGTKENLATKEKWAMFKCDKCGRKLEQKLRTSNK